MKQLADMVVLFVDDDPENNRALKRLFYRDPYRKIFVESGAEALELLEREHIDIVATDLKMPDMNGEQLIRIVKSHSPDTVIIVVSGTNEIEHIVESIGNNLVFGLVTKPIDSVTIKQTINDAIAHCMNL